MNRKKRDKEKLRPLSVFKPSTTKVKEKDSAFKLSDTEIKTKLGKEMLSKPSKIFTGFNLLKNRAAGNRIRSTYKIYVGDTWIESFIVYGLYLRLKGVKSMSSVFAKFIIDRISEVREAEDPLYDEAIKIYNHHKALVIRNEVKE